MAEASDFKIDMQVGLDKAHQQITPVKKWTWLWATGVPQNLGFPFNISAMV